MYDIVESTWETTPVANHDISFGRVKASFVVDDTLFTLTWHEDHNVLNFAYVNILELDEWRLVDNRGMPKGSKGCAACYVEYRDEVVVVDLEFDQPPDVRSFSMEKRAWYKPNIAGVPPCSRMKHGMCSNKDQVYVVGGWYRGILQSGSLELYILQMAGTRFIWSTPRVEGYIPPHRYLFRPACTQNRLFVYGGYNGIKSFDVFLFKENRWYQGSGNGRHNGQIINFRTAPTSGASANALVQTQTDIWILGGFEEPPDKLLRISAK